MTLVLLEVIVSFIKIDPHQIFKIRIVTLEGDKRFWKCLISKFHSNKCFFIALSFYDTYKTLGSQILNVCDWYAKL